MRVLLLTVALLSLSGCATFMDYCDLGVSKRCDLEAQMNNRLDMAGSQARIALQCPGEELCLEEAIPGSERGDFQTLVVKPR